MSVPCPEPFEVGGDRLRFEHGPEVPARQLDEFGADPRCTPSPLRALLERPGGRKTQPAHDVVACLALLLERGAAPHTLEADGKTLRGVAGEDPNMPAEVFATLRVAM